MDFFEAQARAKRRTGRLVVLFALAVGGTIAALYLAFVAGTAWMHLRTTADGRGVVHYPQTSGGLGAIDWWQPGALQAITLLVVPTVVISAFFKWRQLREGGPAVAEMVGGRRVEPDTEDLRERTLLNVVEEMALASGVAVPAVYLLPDEAALNAFAAGYSPADAAVTVTEGTLAHLDRDELQAVVAHEFSHILNGDMRLNTRLSALVFGILSIFVLGRTILHSLSQVRSDSSRRGGKGGGAFFFAGLALLVIGYLGHLFARLIQAAVSRQREFLADAAAVQFTRNPSGLADALKKVGGSSFQGRLNTPEAVEISHFCFVQNFRSGLGGLFATHPPLVERIRAIDPAFDGTFTPLPPLLRPELIPYPPAAAPAPPPFARVGAAPIDPVELIGAAGQLSPAAVQAGRELLGSLPGPLREAAHDPARVAALCYVLCLPRPAAPGALEPLLALVTARADASAARQAADLYAALESLPAGHRFGLLQLATPTLRHLEPAACATLLDTLDALVHADEIVTPHEFALQKILTRTLGLAARPRDALHVLAPSQVSPELSLALSFASRLDAADASAAAQAFARAAMGFNGLQPPLAYLPDEPMTLDRLDAALDRLALTPAPFRKRILTALAAAFTADSRLSEEEAGLLRALAAALDCPLPPVLPISE